MKIKTATKSEMDAIRADMASGKIISCSKGHWEERVASDPCQQCVWEQSPAGVRFLHELNAARHAPKHQHWRVRH